MKKQTAKKILSSKEPVELRLFIRAKRRLRKPLTTNELMLKIGLQNNNIKHFIHP